MYNNIFYYIRWVRLPLRAWHQAPGWRLQVQPPQTAAAEFAQLQYRTRYQSVVYIYIYNYKI